MSKQQKREQPNAHQLAEKKASNYFYPFSKKDISTYVSTSLDRTERDGYKMSYRGKPLLEAMSYHNTHVNTIQLHAKIIEDKVLAGYYTHETLEDMMAIDISIDGFNHRICDMSGDVMLLQHINSGKVRVCQWKLERYLGQPHKLYDKRIRETSYISLAESFLRYTDEALTGPSPSDDYGTAIELLTSDIKTWSYQRMTAAYADGSQQFAADQYDGEEDY